MKYMKMQNLLVVALLIVSNVIIAQDTETAVYTQDIPNPNARYLTDEQGNVRMWVNIWGHVNQPGNYLIYNDTDILTVLAMAGGLRSGAALNRIKLYRELPDKHGNLKYTINMNEFIKTGSRKVFPSVLPNDAFYIPQTTGSYLLSNVRIVNTLLSTVNLLYLYDIRRNQIKNN